MAWIILTILVFGLLWVMFDHGFKTNRDNLMGFSFLGLLFGGIMWLGITIAAGVQNNDLMGYTQEEAKWENTIYSLKSDSSIEGRFSLGILGGSGTIDSPTKYYFYRDAENEHGYKTKQLSWVYASRCQIIEDDSQTPKFIKYGPVNKSYNIAWVHPIRLFLGLKEPLNKVPNILKENRKPDAWSNYLIVPEGTIIEKFELD